MINITNHQIKNFQQNIFYQLFLSPTKINKALVTRVFFIVKSSTSQLRLEPLVILTSAWGEQHEFLHLQPLVPPTCAPGLNSKECILKKGFRRIFCLISSQHLRPTSSICLNKTQQFSGLGSRSNTDSANFNPC